MKKVRSVVIVGGGTAGWISAGVIAAHLKRQAKGFMKVTLIESSTIPTIGVGEGTWPTMRNTLRNIGVKESDFIRECSATFKQGAKFAKWATGADNDFYYHPLVFPENYQDTNLAPHWQSMSDSISFSNAVCCQESVCELGLAPKTMTTPEYQSVVNYAYHLDAGRVAAFLTEHCVNQLDVRHLIDEVETIINADDDNIAYVQTKKHGAIEGDLFIDCTGFKSLLLGEHYGIPIKSCQDILFNDTALAVQVPYADESAPIASHTISTATTAGWIWDIGLTHRKGIGHVFSSSHISDDEAMNTLEQYIAQSNTIDLSSLKYRKIPITPGYREKFWHNNCVAIGLSAGFLEPLEASALMLIEIAAMFVAEQFPVNTHVMPIIEKRYNKTFSYRWQRIIDFLKLHYCVSSRTDSQYWIDNRDPSTIPESLKELLTLWKYQYPWLDDFDRSIEIFPSASYQYVLYGMGFKTEKNYVGDSDSEKHNAQKLFQRNQQNIKKLSTYLPKHRELIEKVCQYGFQRI